MSSFIFTTSQVGAEPIIKEEVVGQFPEARLAFSRPGLLTFKLPDENIQALQKMEVPLKSVFARTWGYSIGSVRGETVEEILPKLWELTGERRFDRIHVFGRDLHKIGDYKFEPRLTDEAYDLCRQLSEAYPFDSLKSKDQREAALEGETVLDVILVNPTPPTRVTDFVARRETSEEAQESKPLKARKGREKKAGPRFEWLIGWHRVHSFQSAFPGGMLDLEVPDYVVSRAWLKMEEALRWSHFPIFNARVCEIGSAPGGATQALLARGCEVMGVDPAEMHPNVLADPKFRHIRSRIAFVKRKEFRRVRWLTCDINVPPNYTLDVIESVVMHPEVSVRGMILTLKFPDWNMGFEVKDYIARIKSWGFNIVRARQLHYSHQEICVACLKKPFRK